MWKGLVRRYLNACRFRALSCNCGFLQGSLASPWVEPSVVIDRGTVIMYFEEAVLFSGGAGDRDNGDSEPESSPS